jgi:flagellar motor protein MotB
VAAGGGGSWKVAYADFVTAMMAFFMVMWICAQDQDTREAVAHYFNEPYKFFKDPVGVNRQPSRPGALFPGKKNGYVSENDKINMAQGRESFSPNPTGSPPTKTVSDWLYYNEKAAEHWRDKATQAIQAASESADAVGKPALIEEKAAKILAKQMEAELKQDRPKKKDDTPYDDLLAGVLGEVNWQEIAEDLLRRERLPRPH